MNELVMLTLAKMVLGLRLNAKCYRNGLELVFPTGPLIVTDLSTLFCFIVGYRTELNKN